MKRSSGKRPVSPRRNRRSGGKGRILSSPSSSSSFPVSAEVQQLRHQVRQLKDALELQREQLASEESTLIQSQQELESSRERYVELFESAPIGYLSLDRNGFIRNANHMAAIMLGRDRANLMGHSSLNLVAKEDRRRFNRYLVQTRRQETAVTDEIRFRTPEGAEPIMQLTGIRANDPGQSWPSIRVAIIDITERKQQERRLQVRDLINAVLAADPGLQEASQRILEALCGPLNCEVGAIWLAESGGDELYCASFWHHPDKPVPEFEAATRQCRFSSGEDLPGKVFSTGEPVIAPDLGVATGVSRSKAARKCGLRCSFFWPIKLGNDVFGVIEGCSRQPRPPDDGFLNLLTAVGTKLGQFAKRKQAQDALRQNEERLRRILNTSLDAIVTTDMNGKIIGWNPQAEQIFGWPEQEALGRHLADTVIPSPHRAAYEQNLRHYLDTGESSMLEKAIEIRALHRDGREFPVELAMTPLALDGHLAFCAFVRDISERKAAEEMLRHAHDELEERVRERTAELAETNKKLNEALAQMNDLYHRAPCGYHSLDATGRFIQINDTALQWLGYNREELVGKKAVFDIETPASRKAGLEAFRRLKRGESVRDLQLELVRRDGSIMTVSLNSTPVLDDAGRMIRTRSAYVDVSDRVQAEKALARSEARLQAILDFSPAVVFLKDLQGRYLLVNRRFEKAFGLEQGRILGRTDAELFPRKVAAAFRVNDMAVLRSGRAKAFEETAPYADGEHVNVVVKFPLRSLRGHINALGGMAIDITSRKQAEAALRESRQHYRELFEETQKAHQETQRLSGLLLQAQEKERMHISRELHDDVGQILTAVSMTLNGIRWNGDPDADRTKLAEAQRLLQGVMATLHDFATELRPSVLDELGLLSAIRSTIHTVELQSGLQVNLRSHPSTEELASEQKLALFRIFQESLNNVIKHARASRVQITLSRSADAVVLTVADNGRSFISRPSNSTRGRQLGLLGMQERARLVNGRFSIKARPGRGTTVRVQMPVK